MLYLAFYWYVASASRHAGPRAKVLQFVDVADMVDDDPVPARRVS
jgi:hypothetical protein